MTTGKLTERGRQLEGAAEEAAGFSPLFKAGARDDGHKDAWPNLSEREEQILMLIAAGLTNKEIGRVLFLGLETIKTHVSHLLRKLGVRNRTEAAMLAAGIIAQGRQETIAAKTPLPALLMAA